MDIDVVKLKALITIGISISKAHTLRKRIPSILSIPNEEYRCQTTNPIYIYVRRAFFTYDPTHLWHMFSPLFQRAYVLILNGWWKSKLSDKCCHFKIFQFKWPTAILKCYSQTLCEGSAEMFRYWSFCIELVAKWFWNVHDCAR